MFNVRSYLPQELEKQLMLLSPERRKQSRRGLVGFDEGLQDFLKHNLDDEKVNKLLLDPELHMEVLGEQAGLGYREKVIPKTKSGYGTPQLEPSKSLPMSDIEREMVDINNLIRQIEYDQTGIAREHNPNSPVYQMLKKFVLSTGKSGQTQTSKGGVSGIRHSVYGTRDKHPKLPALDEQIRIENTTRQLYDNLMGNKFAIQPAGMIDKNGNMSGIPVEHHLDFDKYPHLGLDPNNRNLGNTFVNSIVRSESDPQTRKDLLISHLAKKINDVEKLSGKSFVDLTKDMDYSPKRTIVRSAGDKFTDIIRVNSPGDTVLI